MLYTGVGVLKMEGPVATYAPWGRRAERFWNFSNSTFNGVGFGAFSIELPNKQLKENRNKNKIRKNGQWKDVAFCSLEEFHTLKTYSIVFIFK